jgi:hypothetical protein
MASEFPAAAPVGFLLMLSSLAFGCDGLLRRLRNASTGLLFHRPKVAD